MSPKRKHVKAIPREDAMCTIAPLRNGQAPSWEFCPCTCNFYRLISPCWYSFKLSRKRHQEKNFVFFFFFVESHRGCSCYAQISITRLSVALSDPSLLLTNAGQGYFLFCISTSDTLVDGYFHATYSARSISKSLMLKGYFR